MERNRCETAIRCLEVALHPNAKDGEVIAAVNGFRRTAKGRPLREVCVELFGKGHDARTPAPPPAKLDRLIRENLDLRRKLEAQEADQAAAAHRLREAEQRLRDLSDELLAADRRASAAEQQLANSRLAPSQKPASPFKKLLAAAHRGADQPDAPERGRDGGGSPIFGRRPWTA